MPRRKPSQEHKINKEKTQATMAMSYNICQANQTSHYTTGRTKFLKGIGVMTTLGFGDAVL